MPAFTITTPVSERYAAICNRAEKRSMQSEAPKRFMNEFHDELSALRREGLDVIVERAPDWLDPVHLAAEIEAITATRAMRCWGTLDGLCFPRRSKSQVLAA